MPNVSVDRPCDIHFIECVVRNLIKMPEAARCAKWDEVPVIERDGVEIMDCPLDCCYESNKDRQRCNLQYWESARMGESLWPIPPYQVP